MEWTEINISVDREYEEVVSGILYSYDIKGLEIDDPEYLRNLDQNKGDWDFIDQETIDRALAKIRDNRLNMKVYFSQEEDPEEKIEEIYERILGEGLDRDNFSIYTDKIMEKDWSENWKKHYKPIRIGKNIVIKPSWEDYKASEGDLIIEIDPGMAFGTGTHETTSMCTEALEKYLEEDDQVFDIGCGSGILSIVAAKLGARAVTGIDLDRTAVKVARENVEDNGLEDIIRVEEGDLLDLLDTRANIIVANIIAEVILTVTDDIAKYLEPGGLFISSGIIESKQDLVVAQLEKNDFQVLEIMQQKDWVCIIARHKGE